MQGYKPDMTKQARKRQDIIDLLADHVLAHGLSGASLRTLATAAGTSDRMLLYYFQDKAALVAATLEQVALRMQEMLAAVPPEPRPLEGLLAELAQITAHEGLWPYMRLWLEVASQAANGDPVCREVGGRIGRSLLDWGRTRLSSPPDQLEAHAARLLVMIEGLVLLQALGLADVAEAAL